MMKEKDKKGLKMKKLSKQEVEVIKHSSEGYSAKEIAKVMDLHPRTIEAYITTIRKKLQAKNMAHAVSIAYKKNLMETP